MPSDVARLICGEVQTTTGYASIFRNIGATLDDLLLTYAKLLERNDEAEIGILGPFIGRSVLELTATALIGRLDPFRIMVLRETQLHSSFGLEKRNKAAIQWSGDVMAEKAKPLWENDRAVSDMTRALLGDYYAALFWVEAFTVLIDKTPEGRGGAWMEAMRRVQPEGVANFFRRPFAETFSSSSKGVHHELVIPRERHFDRASVRELVGTAIKASASLALVANCVEHITFPLPLDDAITCIEAVQESEELW